MPANNQTKKTALNLKKVMCGKTERVSFARVEEPIDLPYLVSIQKDTYKEFLEKGIGETIAEFSPIEDFSGKAELHFLDYSIDYDAVKYPIDECRRRALTYSAPIRVNARLINKDTGEAIDQNVLLGDVPLMTKDGSFLISGVDRVVVSQIVRSPGVYCEKIDDKNTGKTTYTTKLNPNRGMWLEFEQTQKDTIRVIMDRSVKVSAGILLKGLGLGSEKEIAKLFGNHPLIMNTFDQEPQKTEEEALLELRPGQQFGVVVEVVADGGKDTVQHVLHADGRKVELRPCHRHKNVDEIVKEEGGDDDKRHLLQQVEAADEVPQHDDQHHGIVEEVTHVERFAHPDIGQAFGKPDGGLPAKEPLLGRSEHMVQIGEEAVELIRVGIPVGQERHLYRDAHKGGKLTGRQAVEIHQQEGHGSYQRTIAQHPQGMVHPLIQKQYQYRREQVVDERHLLYCKQPLAGIHHLEYI